MSVLAAKSRAIRRPQLERETPLVALAVARTVLEEASQRLGRPLPNRLAARLAHQARRLYAHDPKFRRRLRASGDTGRDTLHAFMHHWLDGLLTCKNTTKLGLTPFPNPRQTHQHVSHSSFCKAIKMN